MRSILILLGLMIASHSYGVGGTIVGKSGSLNKGLATSDTAGLVAPRTVQTNLTFSSTPPGWSLISAKGIAYSDVNGVWRLKFNIYASMTATATASVTVEGYTFATVQAISFTPSIATVTGRAFVGSPGTDIDLDLNSTSTLFIVSGDVELESKPTWAN